MALIGQSTYEAMPLQNPSFACFLTDGELIWGSDDSPCNTVSVREATQENMVLNLYPNPVVDFLNISSHGNAMVKSGVVYNLMGQEVYSFSSMDTGSKIDLQHLNEGVYVLRVMWDNGSTKVGKFIKQR